MGIPRFYRWYSCLHSGSKAVIRWFGWTSLTRIEKCLLSTTSILISMRSSTSAFEYLSTHLGKWLFPQKQGETAVWRADHGESDWVPARIGAHCQSEKTALYCSWRSGSKGQDQPVKRSKVQVRSLRYLIFWQPRWQNRHPDKGNLSGQFHLPRHCFSVHSLRKTTSKDHGPDGKRMEVAAGDVFWLLCARWGRAQDHGFSEIQQIEWVIQQKHHSLRVLAWRWRDSADSSHEPGLYLHHQRGHFPNALS